MYFGIEMLKSKLQTFYKERFLFKEWDMVETGKNTTSGYQSDMQNS